MGDRLIGMAVIGFRVAKVGKFVPSFGERGAWRSVGGGADVRGVGGGREREGEKSLKMYLLSGLDRISKCKMERNVNSGFYSKLYPEGLRCFSHRRTICQNKSGCCPG